MRAECINLTPKKVLLGSAKFSDIFFIICAIGNFHNILYFSHVAPVFIENEVFAVLFSQFPFYLLFIIVKFHFRVILFPRFLQYCFSQSWLAVSHKAKQGCDFPFLRQIFKIKMTLYCKYVLYGCILQCASRVLSVFLQTFRKYFFLKNSSKEITN